MSVLLTVVTKHRHLLDPKGKKKENFLPPLSQREWEAAKLTKATCSQVCPEVEPHQESNFSIYTHPIYKTP